MFCNEREKLYFEYINKSRLCDVVVSMLATGPKGHGFKPGWGDGFLRAIKIRSTPSFRWEVKPEVPCRKILWHVRIPWGISDRQNSHFFVHSSCLPQMSLLVELPESSGGWVRSYPQLVSSLPWLSTLTYHLGDKQLARWWPRFWDIVSPHHNQSVLTLQHGGI
jgi:hypothetical protein